MAYSERFKTPEQIIAETATKKQVAEQQQKLVIENGVVMPEKDKKEEIEKKLELGPEQQ